ncbi:uncharacterized protein LOC110371475 [Helicoverpa armigera]|uniref:uncharacterized protein LOC110371475 n=1 Tax=Helicoverpa armigera TaxID=29058 RepID=UPI00308285C5
MPKIATFVFFDIETTGLPHQERNKTKITELSFVAALRNDMKKAPFGAVPYISKLTLLFNPQKDIHPVAAKMTGLSNESLKNAPIFRDNVATIVSFLSDLPKPVCLVAHNGDRFDYRILLAEFLDVNASLPQDLLCVDSLTGFKHIIRSPSTNGANTSNIRKDDSLVRSISMVDDSLLEEDSLARDNNSLISEDSLISDDWPELDVSTEDWKEIDSLCSSFSDMPLDNSRSSRHFDECKEPKNNKDYKETEKISYTLSNLYKRIMKKEVYNAHRAEDDCLMLLECVAATKEFLPWADRSCKNIYDIVPLDRKKYKNNHFTSSSLA